MTRPTVKEEKDFEKNIALTIEYSADNLKTMDATHEHIFDIKEHADIGLDAIRDWGDRIREKLERHLVDGTAKSDAAGVDQAYFRFAMALANFNMVRATELVLLGMMPPPPDGHDPLLVVAMFEGCADMSFASLENEMRNLCSKTGLNQKVVEKKVRKEVGNHNVMWKRHSTLNH